MAGVANRLLGEEFAVGYNMSLDEKPEIAIDNLTDIVKEIDQGRGVIMLVDMGSLAITGDIIYERTGIRIKTIEMASTPVVIEAARKALISNSLDEIYDDTLNLSPYVGKFYRENWDTSDKYWTP